MIILFTVELINFLKVNLKLLAEIKSFQIKSAAAINSCGDFKLSNIGN